MNEIRAEFPTRRAVGEVARTPLVGVRVKIRGGDTPKGERMIS